MTMTTTVRINAPINPIRLLDWLTVTVGGDPTSVVRVQQENALGETSVRNAAGQGLKAWCWVTWFPDGPLPTDDEEEWEQPAAIVECSFDTAYGYSEIDGTGCGGLHAFILLQLRDWLARQNITDARWFAGEYIEDYQPLSDLSQHGGVKS